MPRDHDHDPPAAWRSLRGSPPLRPGAARPPGSRSPASALTLTAESRRPCPHCGSEQGTHPVAIPPRLRAAAGGADVRYYWADCPCEAAREQAYIHRAASYAAEVRRREADQLLAGAGLDQVQGMTLERFDPRRLKGDDVSHPYQVASRWLATITERPLADYHDRSSPPAALYFYCPGKGRGKTHLAAGLAWELRRTREVVCFLHEEGYCTRLWSVPFEDRERAISVPSEKAWLTVLDDLGRLNPGPGVQNAWDGLLNRRWLRRRWLLVTSNFTLEELLERGTLSEASYSRLRQMTRGEYVYFDGEDQRLVD